MKRSHALTCFISQRTRNLEKSRYVRQALSEQNVKNIGELSQELQLAIEREAGYFQGFVDGLRLGRQ